MTFKHIKFEDSETMRSLERVAYDKGIVKEDSILEKIASKSSKLDLNPTDNLVENIMKLCSGLRVNGMEKYASELESRFVLYKKACIDSDIIDQAHPKGSHKLEGVEGDCVVESVIDQQKEDLKVVERKPTGKLASSKDIINAVKISLAIEELPIDNTAAQMKGKELMKKAIDSVISGCSLIKNFYEPNIHWYKGNPNIYNHVQEIIKDSEKIINIPDTVYIGHLNKLNEFFYKVRTRRDAIVNIMESKETKLEKEGGNTAYKGISLIDNGISLAWGANQAFKDKTGDPESASKFHEDHIDMASVIEVISSNLISPLYNINGNALKIKSNIDKIQDINKKTQIQNVIAQINESLNLASRASAKMKSNKDLRVVIPANIHMFFDGHLKGQLAGVNSLYQFKSKCDQIVSHYKNNLDKINVWMSKNVK